MMTLAFGSLGWGAQTPQFIVNARDLKSALKAAKTPGDHERIAVYCQEKADQLDAAASGYENQAQAARNAPVVKNMTATNAAARYEAMAKDLRNRAQSYRTLAAAQDKLARQVEMGTKWNPAGN
jgi:hypothetical protein